MCRCGECFGCSAPDGPAPEREDNWPFRGEAVSAGCTCKWWGEASIVVFDPDCPVADRHRKPTPTYYMVSVTFTAPSAESARHMMVELQGELDTMFPDRDFHVWNPHVPSRTSFDREAYLASKEG